MDSSEGYRSFHQSLCATAESVTRTWIPEAEDSIPTTDPENMGRSRRCLEHYQAVEAADEQWFSNFSLLWHHPEGFLKQLCSTPRVSYLVDQGEGSTWDICTSSKFPNDVDAVRIGETLRTFLSRPRDIRRLQLISLG